VRADNNRPLARPSSAGAGAGVDARAVAARALGPAPGSGSGPGTKGRGVTSAYALDVVNKVREKIIARGGSTGIKG
jgi:hypothetical protein